MGCAADFFPPAAALVFLLSEQPATGAKMRGTTVRRVDWLWVLIGGLMALAFRLILASVGLVAHSIQLGGILALVGYVMAGVVIGLIVPRVPARDPALGAGLGTFLLGVLQNAIARPAGTSWSGILVGLLLASVIAFLLTWLGNYLTTTLVRRRTSPTGRTPTMTLPRGPAERPA